MEVQRWEYFGLHTMYKPKNDQMIEEMNRLGAEGWEFVSVISSPSQADVLVPHIIMLLFKRPLMADAAPVRQ
jgi:hypothetical protein